MVKKITRRTFLTGGAKKATESHSKASEGAVAKPKKMTRRAFFKFLATNKYARTAIETVLVNIGASIAFNLAHNPKARKQILKGNAKLMAERDPMKLVHLIENLVAIPIAEEIFFRLIPSDIVDKIPKDNKGKTRWEYGIPVSAIFAAGHLMQYPKEVASRFIPVNHFVNGCYYWFLMRERGIDTAVMSHAQGNLMASIIWALSKKRSPQPTSKPK